jgi:alanyl-tRNA synthetase
MAKPYQSNSYVRTANTQVISVARVGDYYEVKLADSPFYPGGGGQPSDRGTIAGVPVLDVLERGDEIVHLTATPVDLGPAEAVLDWNRRFDLMQQHSGQHVLSQAFYRLFGTPTIGFHLTEDVLTIDVEGTVIQEQAEQAERLANEVIRAAMPVQVQLYNRGDKLPEGLRKLPEGHDVIRLVAMGDFDLCPCGGTHVGNTAEIGLIKALRLDKAHGGTRVSFLCGNRAIRDYGRKTAAMIALTQILSKTEDAVVESVSNLVESLDQTRKEMQRVKRQLIEQWTAAQTGNNVAACLSEMGLDELKLAAAMLTNEHPERVAYLYNELTPAQVVLARGEGLAWNAGKTLKELLAEDGGKGGGTDRLAQGVLAPGGGERIRAKLAERGMLT